MAPGRTRAKDLTIYNGNLYFEAVVKSGKYKCFIIIIIIIIMDLIKAASRYVQEVRCEMNTGGRKYENETGNSSCTHARGLARKAKTYRKSSHYANISV